MDMRTGPPQHCFIEGSGSVPGPYKHQPLDYLGLCHRHVLFLLSPLHPSAIFWEEDTKGSRSGVREGFSLSPSPSPHAPYSSPERRCSYQKRLLKDDLFYFSLTFPSLGKWKEKKKTKSTIKDQKNPIRKPPPNPQKVMSFPYSWNFFVLFLEIVFF